MSNDRGATPLPRQIMRRVLVPLLVAFALFVIPLGVLDVRASRLQAIEVAERHAATIALLVGDAVAEGVSGRVSLDRLGARPGEQAALLDGEGRFVAGSELPDAVLDGPAVTAAFAGDIGGSRNRAARLVVGAAPVLRRGEVAAVAVVTLPDATIVTRAGRTSLLLAALSLVLFAGAGFAGRSLARTIVRPVEELDRVGARLRTGDLDARASVEGAPPELQRLADTLNETAAELQRLLAAQRSFVAVASHQMRTPLAGLRLRLENAEMATGDPDGRLAAAIDEVDRLSALLAGLLGLARAERGEARAAPADLAGIVRHQAAQWTDVAVSRDVTVRCSTPEIATVLFVPGGLEQVLDNLLANAVRVAPSASQVDIEVDAADGVWVLHVADRGPGMSSEERERAFERFWRAPGAAPDGGTGLGLSIAAELVRASGGSIALHEREGGGLIAEVVLRRATAGDRPV